MADVKQINLNGTVYDISDETARQNASDAQTKAEQANTKAQTAITTANNADDKATVALDGAYDITYSSNVLTFTKKELDS